MSSKLGNVKKSWWKRYIPQNSRTVKHCRKTFIYEAKQKILVYTTGGPLDFRNKNVTNIDLLTW